MQIDSVCMTESKKEDGEIEDVQEREGETACE